LALLKYTFPLLAFIATFGTNPEFGKPEGLKLE
jgi:hypothetical protein